ncbi:MAG: protein-L-isoaspartate(D-aspartate) O-methyltransferase [Candidatus Bipolaricaulota bacterium]|nr:protein-L-isoaspartate(D-aspartate) O-methyltransferase [Candidatus Bipolaricaulota bacterium]
MNRQDSRDDSFARQRKHMVNRQLRSRGIKDPRVLSVMERVPRHLFLPTHLWGDAYADYPVPIGEGQTISQPYMVAIMSQALELTGGEKVLEIGTGVGYQTAILAELSGRVFTVERIPSLAQTAQEKLRSLNYTNIHTSVGDGTVGLPEQAPFDRIMATGSLPRVPEEFKRQLKQGGIIVLPVGGRMQQQLTKIKLTDSGLITRKLGACRFVPLIGEAGW